MIKLNKMKVKIYGSTFCPYCSAAKDLATQKELDFEYINFDDDPDLREKMAKDLDYYTVPMIFVDDNFVGGFTEFQKVV